MNGEIKYITKEDKDEVLVIIEIKQLTQELIEHRKISLNITYA